jgi:hypothetical protein
MDEDGATSTLIHLALLTRHAQAARRVVFKLVLEPSKALNAPSRLQESTKIAKLLTV